MSARDINFKMGLCFCRQVDASPNSWRETSWCWSTAGTFLNIHMTRLSCSYGPAESLTPESWPCLSDGEVCASNWESKLLKLHGIQAIVDFWTLCTALNPPCVPGPGRMAPLLQLPSTLKLTDHPQGDQPPSSSPTERVMTLEESMRQLERGIQSGTLCFHFEVFKIQTRAKTKNKRVKLVFKSLSIYEQEQNTFLF